MDCEGYRDIAAAHADNQLDEGERREAEAHLAACPRCALAYREQQIVRDLLRARTLLRSAPPGVQRRIAALGEPQGRGAQRVLPRARRRAVLVGLVAASVALLVLPLWRRAHPDLLALMVEDVRAADAGQIPLAVRTSDLDELRAYYRTTGRIEVAEPVADLRPAGFAPVGGGVARVNNVSTTRTVYEGHGAKVVCRRFRADALALPHGGERVGGALVFVVGGVTVRIAREGDTVCCLSSSMPREDFLRLLQAKTGAH